VSTTFITQPFSIQHDRSACTDIVPDCTPKAITHRITKFRSAAKDNGGGKEGTPKPKTTKASAPRKGAGKKSAAEVERTPSPGGDGEEGILTPPATTTKRAGSKRISASADAEGEDDEGNSSKKVKVEEGGDADAEGEEAVVA
jgi:hypothetical protein